MGNVDELSAFRESIVRSYGSVDSPNWTFVNEVVSRDPYAGIFQELSRHGEVVDDTDINCDVCFTYLVTGGSRPVSIRLSMVGPYALVLVANSDEPDAPLDVISSVDDAAAPEQRRILRLLDEHGFKLLGAEVLERPVRFALDGADVAVLYHALFAFEGLLPWRGLPT